MLSLLALDVAVWAGVVPHTGEEGDNRGQRSVVRGGLRWRVVMSGSVPAAFEGGEESVFDFGGDMAVGLDDAVVEAVPESAGLGDFGDLVGDEPGFVAVAQPVEGQAAADGMESGVGAVVGGSEDAPDEGGAP
nr:hypothetical protein [Qaidamihabitans albus]